MAFEYRENASDEEKRLARQAMYKKMRAEKERILRRRKILKVFFAGILAAGVFSVGYVTVGNAIKGDEPEPVQESSGLVSLADEESPADSGNVGSDTITVSGSGTHPEETKEPVETSEYDYADYPQIDFDTKGISDDVISTNAVLLDLDGNRVISQRGMNDRISPASMTKVMTVLVAYEELAKKSRDGVIDLDDTFTMTIEITDYAYSNDCSSVGFLDGEVVTVRDLFYGTILPSGGDAAVGLACYVAGSQEAFVELMNEKLKQMDLDESAHFTNCVGLFDDDHYCSVFDIALIMREAAKIDFLRDVLSLHTYTTSGTEHHPDGITVSNWFLRRIEDRDKGGEVLCAKTGFVNQSGNCAVSLFTDNDGKEYICASAGSSSSWKCIADHVNMYLSID
ncbi:MAG: D-alanyl-D-alanine carboxypeptidase [Lachnospiraceae bacterium]|nr:D-alanyl-D-alanine carboxypeptidase [Lachnospiraceae bacterium]